MAIKTQNKLLFQLASSNGDGTGTTNMIGDYSSAATQITVTPASSDVYMITRMIVFVEDAGSFDSGAYANGITLTNGIDVLLKDGSGTITTLTPFPITTNAEWAAMCHDVTVHDFGTGNTAMSVRWTFERAGKQLKLDGSEGQFLEISFNDDYTGVITHQFLLQGYIYDENY